VDPVVAGDLVVVSGEMRIVDCRGAGAGSAVPGDLDGATAIECTDDDLIGPIVMADPHALTQ
jgi:hypothetical protein